MQPTGIEGSSDVVKPSAPISAQADDLSKILLGFGIFAGSATHRLRLARSILESGYSITEEDLKLLIAHAREKFRAASPTGLVVCWLRERAWNDILRDAQRQKREADMSRPPQWSPPSEWDEEVRVHAILSVAMFDRKTAEEVAKRFGITADRVRELVDTEGRRAHGDQMADRWLGRLPPPKFVRQKKKA